MEGLTKASCELKLKMPKVGLKTVILTWHASFQERVRPYKYRDLARASPEAIDPKGNA